MPIFLFGLIKKKPSGLRVGRHPGAAPPSICANLPVRADKQILREDGPDGLSEIAAAGICAVFSGQKAKSQRTVAEPLNVRG